MQTAFSIVQKLPGLQNLCRQDPTTEMMSQTGTVQYSFPNRILKDFIQSHDPIGFSMDIFYHVGQRNTTFSLVWNDTWQKEITGNAMLFPTLGKSLCHLIMSSQEGEAL